MAEGSVEEIFPSHCDVHLNVLVWFLVCKVVRSEPPGTSLDDINTKQVAR